MKAFTQRMLIAYADTHAHLHTHTEECKSRLPKKKNASHSPYIMPNLEREGEAELELLDYNLSYSRWRFRAFDCYQTTTTAAATELVKSTTTTTKTRDV